MTSSEIDSKDCLFVCSDEMLGEGKYRRIDVFFRGKPDSIIIVRHQGKVIAYRNLCVHMPRTLDCESDFILDDSGEHLRCSMHGIVYSLETGESLSEICRGKKLTAIRAMERDQGIYISDRRVKARR